VTRSHAERVDALLRSLLDELTTLKDGGLPNELDALANVVRTIEDALREFVVLSRITLGGP
jgi:hypothetical protein